MAKSIADTFESNVDYKTVLDNFEGPLDLLLYLINRNEIDIKDIFVSQVTTQFLDYMNGLPYLDTDKASEYLVIASTILAIKAKSLVPNEEFEDGEEEEEDEDKADLIKALEEYKLIKEETEKLKERETIGFFFKQPDKTVGETKVIYKDFNLDGLIDAFTKMMVRREVEQKKQTSYKEIPLDQYTVADKIKDIRLTLKSEQKNIKFEDLFHDAFNRVEVITTFQALLELLKYQFITVKQNGVFGEIEIALNPNKSEEEEIGQIDEYN